MPKPTILFLCTGNSCRSQMAHGWANHLHAQRLCCYSAGIEQHGLNPLAVQVMAEVGVDISHHRSQTLDELPVRKFDYVITVCDHAAEHCPIFPAKTGLIHHSFDDPPKLAAGDKDPEAVLGHYRRVRDEIKAFITSLPEILNNA